MSRHDLDPEAGPVAGSSECFPRAARVRAKADFGLCFAARRRVGGAHLLLQWRPVADARHGRLGLAIGRKVDVRAVGRNRLKRLAREMFRRHAIRRLPVDIVVTARHTARTARVQDLMHELNTLFDRIAGALPRSAPQGTMRGAPAQPEASAGGEADAAPSPSRIS